MKKKHDRELDKCGSDSGLSEITSILVSGRK